MLILKVINAVDLSHLPWGTEVTISDGTTTIKGKVVTATAPMEDPPTLEGDYHIAPVIKEPNNTE